MEIGDHILQVLLALLLVIGLVVALGLVVRRMNHGAFKSGGDIRVVASTFLGPKERILLVRVRDREVLLGVNPQCISALGEFAAGEATASFDTALKEAGA